jgi:signal transduction histidine kinase
LLQTLFVEAPIASAITDLDGRCVAVNQQFCAVFGAPPSPRDCAFHDELIAARGLMPYLCRALAGERVSVPAFWHDAPSAAGPDGARRGLALELAMTPIRDRDGVARHVALHYRDVTAAHELAERRRTSAERVLAEHDVRLREAHRLKNEFLAAMSHELRTPLNTIIGFSELVFYGRVTPDSPEHHEFVGDILASSRHLLQLLNDVLDLAMVEAGKLELRPEPVVVAAAIAEVSSLLRTLSLAKRIRVDVEVESASEVVVVDPIRFKQVLYNYLSNALKFTPEGGHVIVRSRAESAAWFRLEVEDTGVGIPREEHPQLFLGLAPRPAGTGAPFGTGIGLALTRRIVEAQGGMVGVDSEPGRGSMFHAILPRHTPAR